MQRMAIKATNMHPDRFWEMTLTDFYALAGAFAPDESERATFPSALDADGLQRLMDYDNARNPT